MQQLSAVGLTANSQNTLLCRSHHRRIGREAFISAATLAHDRVRQRYCRLEKPEDEKSMTPYMFSRGAGVSAL
jgi:hypothetical protein